MCVYDGNVTAHDADVAAFELRPGVKHEALGKLFASAVLEGVADEQVADEDIGLHLDQVPRHEVMVGGVLLVCNILDCLLMLLVHASKHLGKAVKLAFVGKRRVFCNDRVKNALHDTADCGDDLELRGSFVYVRDADIAIEAFCIEVVHESRAAVDLDAVIGYLVRDFRGAGLGHRGQDCCELRVGFLLVLDLLRGIRIMLGKVSVGVAEVDDAGGLVKERTCADDLHFHPGEHVVDRRELVYALLELLALRRVFAGVVIGGLGDAERLCTDRYTRAIHERHDIAGQSAAALSAEFGRDIVVLEFAGGYAMNAELVLNAADDELWAGLANEHGEAAAIACAFLGTRQHQVNLGAAVCNEALHSVEIPLPGLRILGGFQAHGLEVGAGIGLGQVHGAVGLATGKARQIALLLLFAAELADRLGDVLQTEKVLQRCIGAGDHLGHHRIDGDREVKAAVTVRKHHSHDIRVLEVLNVFLGQWMVGDLVILEMRSFLVHLPRTGLDALARDFANHAQDAVIIVNGVFEVGGSVLKLLGEFVLLLTEGDNIAHVEMVKRKLQVFIFSKVVHWGVSLHLRLVGLDHLGNDLVQVADDAVVRNRQYRSIGIIVDRDDLLGFGHAGTVLDRAAYAAGDVEFRAYGDAGLADLMVVVDPACVNCSDAPTVPPRASASW